jgi:hypothetical protein
MRIPLSSSTGVYYGRLFTPPTNSKERDDRVMSAYENPSRAWLDSADEFFDTLVEIAKVLKSKIKKEQIKKLYKQSNTTEEEIAKLDAKHSELKGEIERIEAL